MMSRARTLQLAATAPYALATMRPALAQAITLKAGATPSDAFSEPLYFTPAGLAVTLGITLDVGLFTSSAAIAAGCVSGALDVGVGDPVAVANGVLHGIPFRILAPCSVYLGDSNLGIVVSRSSNITRARDLNGATIGVPTLVSSMGVVTTKMWLANDGAQVQFVEMPYSAMVAAIERGAIAAATITQPFLSQLPPTVRILANPHDAIAGRWAESVWFATASWIEGNAGLAKRLTAAIYSVARWSNSHQSETAAALSNATRVDVDRIKSTKRAIFSTARDQQGLTLSLTAAAKVGALSRAVTPAEIMASL